MSDEPSLLAGIFKGPLALGDASWSISQLLLFKNAAQMPTPKDQLTKGMSHHQVAASGIQNCLTKAEWKARTSEMPPRQGSELRV